VRHGQARQELVQPVGATPLGIKGMGLVTHEDCERATHDAR
jgi:hypothetical protein